MDSKNGMWKNVNSILAAKSKELFYGELISDDEIIAKYEFNSFRKNQLISDKDLRTFFAEFVMEKHKKTYRRFKEEKWSRRNNE